LGRLRASTEQPRQSGSISLVCTLHVGIAALCRTGRRKPFQCSGKTLRPRHRAAVSGRVGHRLLTKRVRELKSPLRLQHLRLIVWRYQNRWIEAANCRHYRTTE
jgi:hypothetical protein